MGTNPELITLSEFRRCYRRLRVKVEAKDEPSFLQRTGLWSRGYHFWIKVKGIQDEDAEWTMNWKDLASFYKGVSIDSLGLETIT